MVTSIPNPNCTIMLCSDVMSFQAPITEYSTLFSLPFTNLLSFIFKTTGPQGHCHNQARL